jgi:hypothetical protein
MKRRLGIWELSGKSRLARRICSAAATKLPGFRLGYCAAARILT